jgi:hypothetical protein
MGRINVKSIGVVAILFVMIMTLTLCTTEHHAEEEHGHMMEQLRSHQDDVHYSEKNGLIDTAELIRVHSEVEGVLDFLSEERTSKIISYPCGNCHSKSLDQLYANKDDEKGAHWDVHLQHASTKTMNCYTCHGKKKMDALQSLTGDTISFNESYKLCGQCHSTQYKDWQGGAHGKQMNGWKPPRVAKTCVSCHNPHNPSFEHRLPARYHSETTK